jgi:hypothetical protein
MATMDGGVLARPTRARGGSYDVRVALVLLGGALLGCQPYQEFRITYRDGSRLHVEVAEETAGGIADEEGEVARQDPVVTLEPGRVGVVEAHQPAGRQSRSYSLAASRTVDGTVDLDVEVDGFDRHRVRLVSPEQVLRVDSIDLREAIAHGFGFTRTPDGRFGVHLTVAHHGPGLQRDHYREDMRSPPRLVASVWVEERDVLEIRRTTGVTRLRPLLAVLAVFSAGIGAAGVVLSVRSREFLPMGIVMVSLSTPLLIFALTQLLRPKRTSSWTVAQALEWAARIDPAH